MGKGSGGGSPATSSMFSTSTTYLPQWLTDASQQSVQNALDIAQTPQPGYNNPFVAGLTDTQQSAGNLIRSLVGQFQPAYGQAADAVGASLAPVGGIAPQTFRNGLSSPGFSAYMDPYTQQVIDASRAAGARALDQNLTQIKDSAVTRGAFGGSRDLVMRGGAAADNALGQQQLAAQLLDQGFQRATGLLGQDIGNDLAAQGQNQNAQLQNQRNLQTGGLALGQVAQGAQQSALQDINNLLGFGSLEQNTSQADLTARYQDYLQRLGFPLQTQQLLAQTLASTPSDRTTVGWQQGQQQSVGSSNPILGGLGGMMSGMSFGNALAGAFPSLGMSSGVGSVLGGGLGGLLGLFSDEREKTDIKKLGKDPATGLTLHAYRYKGDPKSYPKVVGPMAQEVEKRFPGSTRKVGGRMVINGLAGSMAA